VASEAELSDIRAAYARSAAIAREADESGIELHACHGYLLDQFLWEDTNSRSDRYGGATPQERAALWVVVIEDVRRAVGEDFPIRFACRSGRKSTTALGS
jgi:2,4-dienoyl-CoA reductase-like NADH-dependent reductase (Old Yellow Enzyme family)